MKNNGNFFRQAGVLISRYFKILTNNKQSLFMLIFIPLLTVLIVSYVATPDMFALKSDKDHSINDSYPVLVWETVVQELDNDDDKDSDENKIVGDDEVTTDKWNGDTEAPVTPTKVDDEHYFLITNAEQLAFLAEAADNAPDYLTYNYLLQADLDMASLDMEPIGNKDHPFTGTFDGNGHIIKNLSIKSSSNNVGLFGYVKSNEKAKSKIKMGDEKLTFYHNGIIENFQIIDSKIKSTGKNVGAFVGTIDKTARVTNVSTKNTTIIADDGNVGAIVGQALSPDVEIYLCYSRATIKSSSANAGGLVGDLGSARLSGAYSTSELIYTGKGDKEKTEGFGALIGKCNDYEEQVKNLYYDSDVMDDYDTSYEAINNCDHSDYAVGVSTEELEGYSSFLVPFKDIKTAYEIENPSEEDQDEIYEHKDDEDYDVEDDKDIDSTYGFKKDGQIAAFYGTQVGIFMLVIVAIFVGVCNSIGEICKERNILKREYMTNLKLSSYVTSKLVVQGVVCAIQMLIVIGIFAIFLSVKGKEIPDTGVIFPSIWIEYYISMFLLCFAADVMSLVVSSVVKSASTANSLIPIVLIVQIVFCGVMFPLEGIIDILSNVMISKWGICALAASTRLNDTQNQFLIENPSTQLSMGSGMSIVDKIYTSTPAHLLMTWGILVAFIFVFALVCRFVLVSVKNDKR